MIDKLKGGGDGDPMRMGGDAAYEGYPVDAEHQGGHVGALRPPVLVLLRQRQVLPVRLQVRGHAGEEEGAGAEAVEQGAVAVSPQDHLPHRQAPVPLLILHNGMHARTLLT